MGKVDIIEEELTYKIRGILYEVHNELGPYLNERQYGDAITLKFTKQNIRYSREAVLPTSFDGEKTGRNRIDFIVENRLIVEIKTVPFFTRKDYAQCLRYLVSSKISLALLVNFSSKYCTIKRVLSPNLLSNP